MKTNTDEITDPAPDDIFTRFDAWYEKPHTWGLKPSRTDILRVRMEAHQWLTELRAYDGPGCPCEAIKAAAVEFAWTQRALTLKATL